MDKVTVTQADREAAGKCSSEYLRKVFLGVFGADDCLAEAFARHRIEATRQRLEGMIVQLGENAAQAAKEYAANMKLLREALEGLLHVIDHPADTDSAVAMERELRRIEAARAALEATNG